MARRKKRTLDDYEDWMDDEMIHPTPGPSPDMGGESEVEKISLRDFVIPEKVAAFVRDFEPCDEFDPGAERFDDGRLREYFKAYVCGLGDPLALYLEDLKLAPEPFRMVTSVATNEPCIFARRKI